MIECIFTLDYEIYGNGEGSLRDLVLEPASRLIDLFTSRNIRFVAFVEAAELQRIDERGTDAAIDLVKAQVQRLHDAGFEVALHLHPQWCNATYERGRWILDYSEYNLCTLPAARISAIITGAVQYLRHVVGRLAFAPLSFRAGNWLFQPTHPAAAILSEHGIAVDSSVFRGGLQRTVGLDYRRAPKDLFYWRFSEFATSPDSAGALIEVPIHTEMVRPWRVPVAKRIGMGNALDGPAKNWRQKITRVLDFARFTYPLKLDFCRMTPSQTVSMVQSIIQVDREEPWTYKPLVAIGHTKDPCDIGAIEPFLDFLVQNGVSISTFRDMYPKLIHANSHVGADRDIQIDVATQFMF